jgi:rubrerythrin
MGAPCGRATSGAQAAFTEDFMSEQFEITELVQVGVEDERTGVAFYGALAKKMKNPQLQKLFANLSEQERYHQKRFEQMLADLGGLKPGHEEYPGQYMAYLRTLTNDRAFPDQQTAMLAAANCASDAAAVELATRYERDTLMLMNEMKTLVPEKDKPVVDELAREEQVHLVMLSEAKRKML